MSQPPNIGMFAEFLEATDDFNKRFFRTTKGLLTQPEKVVDRILTDPHSKEYVNPYRYALLTLSFYTICATWLQLNMVNLSDAFVKNDHGIELAPLWQVIDNAMVLFSFIALIPTAFLVSKLFRNSGKSSVVCYKISLYSFSVISLAGLFIIAPVKLFVEDVTSDQILSIMEVTSVVLFIYIGWVYTRCFAVTAWQGIWKTVIIFIGFNFFVILLMTIIAVFVGMYEGYHEVKAEQSKNEVIESQIAPKKDE